MREFEIVIARYNEDISWSYRYKDNCIIYNKGDKPFYYPYSEVIELENVGRESHTYLYHIITRWDILPEKILFTQGNILDHINQIMDINIFLDKRYDFIIKNARFIKDYDSLTGEILHWGKWKKELEEGKMRKAKKSFIEWCKDVLNLDFNNNPVFYGPGAIFSVNKKLIYSKPIDFYRYLISFLEDHRNPEEGHYFERTWVYIFCNEDCKILTF